MAAQASSLAHLDQVRRTHERGVRPGLGRAVLGDALARKDLAAGLECFAASVGQPLVPAPVGLVPALSLGVRAVSVDNPNVVDAVGTDRATGGVVLTISDHLEWDAANEHLVALHAKINSYLDFIQSGQLLEEYPAACGKPVTILLCCKFAPSADGMAFLGRVQEVIAAGGWFFSWRVFEPEVA